MDDLEKQTSRIILLRGALELISNSSDIVFTKAWAQRALERDLESRPTQRAADVADGRPLCTVCNGYHFPAPKEGHFKPQRR